MIPMITVQTEFNEPVIEKKELAPNPDPILTTGLHTEPPIPETPTVFKNPPTKSTPKINPIQKFEEIIIPIDNSNQQRISDCQSSPPIPDPVPMKIQVKDFNFQTRSNTNYLNFGLVENNGWPILLGYHLPKKIEKKNHVIVTIRGDKGGFHRSAITHPVVEFSRTKREDASLVFLEELLYADDSRNLSNSSLMLLCHYREYPGYGKIGAGWPALEGGENWKIISKLFPDTENTYEIIAYSNGIYPRSEFIKRDFKKGAKYMYFNPAQDEPTDFLQRYIEATKLTNKKSTKIKGMIDFEGQYFDGKPIWDLAAFLVEEIEPDDEKYYYSIVRIEENNAYQNTVKIIQAMDLKGKEDQVGIIRYQNKKGNIVFDIITSVRSPHYSYHNVDLREKTNFQPAKNPVRTQAHHGSIVEIGFSRLNSREWPKDIPIITENIQNTKFASESKKQNF